MPPPFPRLRLWPISIILTLAGIALCVIWIPDTAQRQLPVMYTLGVAVLATLFLALWAVFFSRLAGRQRILIALGLAGVAVIAGLTVRIKGVSGDFVPILAWRWASEAFGGSPTATFTPETRPLRDYAQFLGPSRNATLPNIRLLPWETHPPRVVWRRKVGPAWSAFAIVGDRAVTQEQRGPEECVVGYDLQTGEQQWIHADSARYQTTLAGIGPRATPTIANGRVYAYGATGLLNCLDLSSGEKRWSRDVIAENGSQMKEGWNWGASGSPLLLGDLVIVSPGGPDGRSLVAYDAETGDLRWHAGDSAAGYSSPMVAKLTGRKQILIFNRGDLSSHDPVSGLKLWSHPWPGMTECTSQPVPLTGDRVFLSSGYGIGCKLFKIDRADETYSVSVIYETPRLKAKFTNVVIHNDSIYGLDDGVLVCLDPETGQRRWKGGRYGHGQIMLIGDRILVLTEEGELILVAADPTSLVELSRIPALDGRTWNNPAFAPPFLIVRNDHEAVCFEVAVEERASSARWSPDTNPGSI